MRLIGLLVLAVVLDSLAMRTPARADASGALSPRRAALLAVLTEVASPAADTQGVRAELPSVSAYGPLRRSALVLGAAAGLGTVAALGMPDAAADYAGWDPGISGYFLTTGLLASALGAYATARFVRVHQQRPGLRLTRGARSMVAATALTVATGALAGFLVPLAGTRH